MGVPPATHAAGVPPVELISDVEQVSFSDEWFQLADATHFWFEWRLAAALRLVRDLGVPVDRPLRALDIGAGTGVLRDQLEASTAWVIDIADLHLEALRLAREGRGRRLFYDILEQRPEFIGRYDVVILFDVLEHIEATAPFVRAVLRHLRPGGHLLLNVPAAPGLYSAYDRAAGHVRRYDRATLAAEFAQETVDVLAVRHWGMSLLPLLALRTLSMGGGEPDPHTIRNGFRPPSRAAHALLRAMRRIETAVLPGSTPAGSSLLLAARRREG